MLDLGIRSGDGEYGNDYEITYLSQISPGDQITGEIYVGDLKSREIKNKEIKEFYVIITDHENKQKWICGFITSVYFNDDVATIYGERGGRVYQLIDSLSHAINGTELNQREKYSVLFETFRETINEKIGIATVRTVKSENPNAKTPNLEVVDVNFYDED